MHTHAQKQQKEALSAETAKVYLWILRIILRQTAQTETWLWSLHHVLNYVPTTAQDGKLSSRKQRKRSSLQEQIRLQTSFLSMLTDQPTTRRSDGPPKTTSVPSRSSSGPLPLLSAACASTDPSPPSSSVSLRQRHRMEEEKDGGEEPNRREGGASKQPRRQGWWEEPKMMDSQSED